jgi:hypothetical protein
MATTDPVEDISEPSGDEARNGRMAEARGSRLTDNGM